jgi:hypothetical protein
MDLRRTPQKKKDNAMKPVNKHSGGHDRPQPTQSEHVTVTAQDMTPEQERQWQSALDLLLDAMVRQQLEGKDQVT